MKRLLLDCDGVLADFFTSFAQHHFKLTTWQAPGNYGIIEGYGVPEDEVWNGIGRDFWENLPKTDEADKLVAEAKKMFRPKCIGIITAVPTGKYGFPKDQLDGYILGKQHWIHRHYPEFAEVILWGSAKYFCAGPDTILIDDHNDNVDEFRAFGGRAILMPRPWNRMYDLADNSYEVVLSQLKELLYDN